MFGRNFEMEQRILDAIRREASHPLDRVLLLEKESDGAGELEILAVERVLDEKGAFDEEQRLQSEINRLGLPLSVYVLGAAEFRAQRAEVGTLAYEAVREGAVIYASS